MVEAALVVCGIVQERLCNIQEHESNPWIKELKGFVIGAVVFPLFSYLHISKES